MEGWIKLHRKLLEWEWYDEPNTFRLFLHCLLKANHKDKKYRGDVIKAGTFYTSRDLLSKETGLTGRQVRTSLNRLKTTNELTIESSRKGTVIEVVNYTKYQVDDQQNDQQTTKRRPTKGQRATTNKNDKNDKNDKNNKIESIDSTKLMAFFNDTFNKKHEVCPPKTIQKFRNLLKMGFTKGHIMRAMVTVSKNDWHIKNYNHQITIDYFADANNLNKWGNEEPQKELKYNPHL
jgi:hypothetical protein